MFVPRFKEFSRYTPKPLPPKRQRDWGYSWANGNAVDSKQRNQKDARKLVFGFQTPPGQ